MEYNYRESINIMLRELEEQILEEYDNAPEISVRVELLELNHNAASQYEKIVDADGNVVKTMVNEHNEEHDKTVIAIHEATPGIAGGVPTKPPESKTGIEHYEKILKEGKPSQKYGTTVGYHAMIASKGKNDRPEIVIYLPATCSPDQVGNMNFAKYAYGIERLCGDEQDYHYAIAAQAMLTAFVLKEIGYDKKAAMGHVFPHNFFARNKKECPARMLYASRLLKRKANGQILNQEETEALREYVPWEVFCNLVERFFERDRFPESLRKNFIYNVEDYEAYRNDPIIYNYEERSPIVKK